MNIYLFNIINLSIIFLTKKTMNCYKILKIILMLFNILIKFFGYLLPKEIIHNNIKSVAIITVGKVYRAELIVKEISFVK